MILPGMKLYSLPRPTNLNIKLISQKVNWFSLQDHLFINIRKDSNTVNLREAGFYELAYDGFYSVLVKRKKNLERIIQGRYMSQNLFNTQIIMQEKMISTIR